MVTLTFPNRSQIVINLQKPLQEVWLAAKSGGYHYKFSNGQWLDTKGQGEFFVCLSRDARCASRPGIGFQFLNKSRMRLRSSGSGGGGALPAAAAVLLSSPRLLTPALRAYSV